MGQGGTLAKILDYIIRNWFKLGLALLVVIAIVKKDMSFNLKLNNPEPMQEEEPVQKPARQESKRPTERYTDAGMATATRTDKFDISNIFGGGSQQAIDALTRLEEGHIRTYIKRFAKVAKGEQKKFGIPRSVILASALLHSKAGLNEAAKQGHNHFALKCSSDWQGAHDDYDGVCLRHYENAWTSFRDHSLYLTTGDIGRSIQNNNPGNYNEWAKAIQQAGAFDDKNFATQLVQVIELYQLED